MTSTRRPALFAAALLLGGASATTPAQPAAALGCLSFDRLGCGCRLQLRAASCPPQAGTSRFHLHAGGTDGAPLWLVVDGTERALRSKRPASPSFGFSRGDTWTEAYVGAGTTVDITYRPAPSTCPKVAPETCEYFDVSARVLISRGTARPLVFQGIGSCGC